MISAARLFADKIDESELTLTIQLHDGSASIACADSGADSELSKILRNDVLRIYKGSGDFAPATAANYLKETFSNIGRDPDYSKSAPTVFTMEVRGSDAESPVLSTVYGRFAVEAKRMKGDINSSLDSVEHNVTAVFYSDEDTENPEQIPESAYVVKLVCPADTVPVSLTSIFEDPVTMSVEGIMEVKFHWSRDNMKIEQVRGVA